MSRNNVKRSSSIRLWSYISAAHCICSSACCSFCSPLHLLLRLLQLNCPKSLFTFRLPGLSWFHSSVSFLCLLSLMTFLCCFAFGEKHAHISGVFITAVYKSLYCHYFANEKKNSKWKKKKRHLGYRIFFTNDKCSGANSIQTHFLLQHFMDEEWEWTNL